MTERFSQQPGRGKPELGTLEMVTSPDKTQEQRLKEPLLFTKIKDLDGARLDEREKEINESIKKSMIKGEIESFMKGALSEDSARALSYQPEFEERIKMTDSINRLTPLEDQLIESRKNLHEINLYVGTWINQIKTLKKDNLINKNLKQELIGYLEKQNLEIIDMVKKFDMLLDCIRERKEELKKDRFE